VKGQFSVEYIIAITLFVSFVFYIFFNMLKYLPAYSAAVSGESVRSEAYQTTELLINDAGEPKDWYMYPDLPKRFGLADENSENMNILSMKKIETMRDRCPMSGYDESMENIVGAGRQFSLLIKNNVNGSLLLDCHPPLVIPGPVNMSIKRIVALNATDYGELVFQMW
jgi:hypothetical protein